MLDATRPSGERVLKPIVLRLVGTLEECLAASLNCMQENLEGDHWKGDFASGEVGRVYLKRLRRYSQEHADEFASLISVTIYLCSATRELRSGTLTQPGRPKPKRTRHGGASIFPPTEPRSWEVGYRIGAVIRRGLAAIERSDAHSGGDSESRPHARPRPHMRKGHWHSFWTGPLKGERKVVLHWLHPILVAAAGEEDPGIIPVIHRVAEPLAVTGGVR
jgi:hypothetical protein